VPSVDTIRAQRAHVSEMASFGIDGAVAEDDPSMPVP
jgi:hypothetical protein